MYTSSPHEGLVLAVSLFDSMPSFTALSASSGGISRSSDVRAMRSCLGYAQWPSSVSSRSAYSTPARTLMSESRSTPRRWAIASAVLNPMPCTSRASL